MIFLAGFKVEVISLPIRYFLLVFLYVLSLVMSVVCLATLLDRIGACINNCNSYLV